MIIDPPSVFDPRSDWEGFLARMRKLLEADPANQDVKDAIRDAEEELAGREIGGPEDR